jgi:hypothetical protein
MEMVNEQLENIVNKYESVATQESFINCRGTIGYEALSLALKQAELGDECYVKRALRLAVNYSSQNGMIFPDIVATEIRTMAIISDWGAKEELRQRRIRDEKIRPWGLMKNRGKNLY